MRNRKTPRTQAVYREVIKVGNRTVRIATYPRRPGQLTGVTFGIGYHDPEAFARIFFEVTEESWKQINASMKKAFAATRQTEALAAAAALGIEPRDRRPPPPTPPSDPTPKAVTGSRRRRKPIQRDPEPQEEPQTEPQETTAE